MWPILVCSIIAIAVFAERLFYFHRATIHVGEFLKGLSNLIRRRNFAEALHESAGTPGPVARVIHAAIIRHDAPRAELRDIVQEAAQLEVPKLERFLPGPGYDRFPGAVAWVVGDGRGDDRRICHDRFKRRLRHCD